MASSFLYVSVSRNKQKKKIKKFKMAQSTHRLKERKKLSKIEKHNIFTILLKGRVNIITGVTSLWKERHCNDKEGKSTYKKNGAKRKYGGW